MLPRRIIFVVPRYRTFISKYSTEPPNESQHDSVSTETKKEQSEKNNAKERINQILKSMIEENASRGEERFESKFPTENKGFRRAQLENFKPDDSAELALKKAATAIAASMGEEAKDVENDLMSKAAGIHKPVNWGELISGMEVDDTKTLPEDSSRARQVKSVLSKYADKTRSKAPFDRNNQRQSINVDLFGSPDLGIFKDVSDNTGTELKMWDYLYENELRIAVTHPPTNYFQKMIQWTNQGKIWKFPIDNEQGLVSEKDVHFSEHVFLEKHLEGWCPSRGPIKHFMELVCVGLSKNPYITVKDKKDHIMWYKEYFGSKKELLRQVGALQDGFQEKQKELVN